MCKDCKYVQEYTGVRELYCSEDCKRKEQKAHETNAKVLGGFMDKFYKG